MTFDWSYRINIYAKKELHKPLSKYQSINYAMPTLVVNILVGPVAIMQGIYAKHFGLALTTIAFVMLVTRLFDAVSDPLIGYCSDRYYARRGSRKPFIFVGGLLFVISSYFLYVPVDPESLTATTKVSATYFLCWFLMFYMAYTIFEVPHLAWGGEIAGNSTEKNQVFAYRTLFVFVGHILFYLMPLLPVFETDELTPETLKWSVIAVGIVMVPILVYCVKTVPDGVSALVHLKAKQKDTFRELYSSVLGNKPLLIFLCAYLLASFGFGMWYGVLFIFADAYLGVGSDIAKTYSISLSLSLAALVIWYKVAAYWGKKTAWCAGTMITMLGIAGTGFLQPGDSSWLSLLVCMTVIYCGSMALNILAPSILADIVDYGIWKFGTDRAATYFALYALVQKVAIAISGALSLALAGWYGFDPTITTNNTSDSTGLVFAIAWLPSILVLLSIILIALIPINARRHAIIRRSLDSRLIRIQSSNVESLSSEKTANEPVSSLV